MRDRMRTYRCCIAFILAIMMPAAVSAVMYKWVDGQGQTHYSETPPPGQNSEAVKPPPKVDTQKAVRQLNEKQEQFNARKKDQAKQAESTQKSAAQAEEKKQACENSKKSLEKLQTSNRVYEKDKDNNRRRVSEEERLKKIKDSEGQIKKFCN